MQCYISSTLEWRLAPPHRIWGASEGYAKKKKLYISLTIEHLLSVQERARCLTRLPGQIRRMYEHRT